MACCALFVFLWIQIVECTELLFTMFRYQCWLCTIYQFHLLQAGADWLVRWNQIKQGWKDSYLVSYYYTCLPKAFNFLFFFYSWTAHFFSLVHELVWVVCVGVINLYCTKLCKCRCLVCVFACDQMHLTVHLASGFAYVRITANRCETRTRKNWQYSYRMTVCLPSVSARSSVTPTGKFGFMVLTACSCHTHTHTHIYIYSIYWQLIIRKKTPICLLDI